jgi:hypothetical protein
LGAWRIVVLRKICWGEWQAGNDPKKKALQADIPVQREGRINLAPPANFT